MSVIYTLEKRYDDSIRVLEELEDAFPDNPLYVVERGSVKLLTRDWLAARSVFHEVDSQRRLGNPAYQLLDAGLVELRLGESYLFAKDSLQARKFLNRGIDLEQTPDRVVSALYLRRGMSWDRQGRREEAKKDYERVLELDVDKAINNAAKRYLKKAYK